MKNKTIPLHPITSWQIGPNEINNSVTFKPNYFSKPNQTLAEETEGLYYSLSIVQAQALIEDLHKALLSLQNYDKTKETNHFH